MGLPFLAPTATRPNVDCGDRYGCMCKGFLPPFDSTRVRPLMCQNLSADLESINLTTCRLSTKEAADCPKKLRSTSLYPAYITG